MHSPSLESLDAATRGQSLAVTVDLYHHQSPSISTTTTSNTFYGTRRFVAMTLNCAAGYRHHTSVCQCVCLSVCLPVLLPVLLAVSVLLAICPYCCLSVSLVDVCPYC